MRPEWVVDASVVVKLYVTEEFSEEARSFIRDSASRFYAPDFIFLECAHVLLKYWRRVGHPLEVTLQNLYKLRRLRLRPVRVPAFLAPAISLAAKYDLTAYDATYATLAQSLAVPLVTADGKLLRKLKGSDIDIRWIGDIETHIREDSP